MKATAILIFVLGFFHAQEIVPKDSLKKCRKEFSKKVCLSDDDRDGVPLYLDKCPKDSGVQENFGCPWTDTDKDGLIDKDDACPTVVGPIENTGCPWPDTDGDGVMDKDDSCPTIPGVSENNGCPAPKVAHQYSKEELQKVEEDFLDQTKTNNYHAAADLIFKKILKKNFNGNIVYISVLDIPAPGCGSDSNDYSAYSLIGKLIFKSFWDEQNFKKFVSLFPNKTIVPLPRIYNGYHDYLYSELGEIINFKDIPQAESDGLMGYNVQGKFTNHVQVRRIYDSNNNYIDLSIKVEKNRAIVRLYQEDYYIEFKDSSVKEISRSEYYNLSK